MVARGSPDATLQVMTVMTPEPLESDTMRVRWLSVEAGATVHLSRLRGMLDAEELVRADRYRFSSDRNTFTAAHALARRMLSAATGMPPALTPPRRRTAHIDNLDHFDRGGGGSTPLRGFQSLTEEASGSYHPWHARGRT